MGRVVVDRPVMPEHRAFLRALAQAEGDFVYCDNRRRVLAAAALAQDRLAERHPVLPAHYRITPRGQHYLDSLARAH